MDNRLAGRLSKLSKQIEALKQAEEKSLMLDAHEKVLFSSLFLQYTGSVAEREARAYATDEWKNFAKGQALAKVEMNMARRQFELIDKAFQSEYLTYKIEATAIQRGVET